MNSALIVAAVSAIAAAVVAGVVVHLLSRSAARAQLAAASERLAAASAQVAESQRRLDALQQHLSGMQQHLTAKTAEASAAVAERDAARREADQKDEQLAKFSDELRQTGMKAESLRSQNEGLRATLTSERESFQEKLALLSNAEANLKEAFAALASDALKGSTTEFLKLAETRLRETQQQATGDLELRKKEVEQMIQPISESLAKFEKQIGEIETKREGAYQGVTEQVRMMMDLQQSMRAQTNNLVSALKTPIHRGRWGEVQLRRVVELAGMVEHCDFEEQQSYTSEDGKLRPDMIVNLPAGRQIVVDSKVSLAAYLEAAETEDDVVRAQKLRDHATQVKAHLQRLSAKSYWNQLERTPEFVVAFLPGEAFYSAALQQDPSLIEYGPENGVILATPTTLIALLKAVAYGWRQEQLARNAVEISNLGKELHERISKMYEHFSTLRRGLESSVGSFNKLVGSFETRVLVSARKFRELGASGGEEIPETEQIETLPRELSEPIAVPSIAPSGVAAGAAAPVGAAASAGRVRRIAAAAASGEMAPGRSGTDR